jgi:glycerol uptake facilitator-like aquaporin
MEVNKYLVEFLGTAILAYVVLATGNGIAIGAALALLIVVGVSLGSTSYFNPAITVMMVSAKKCSTEDMLPLIGLQVAGALCAYEIFKRMT